MGIVSPAMLEYSGVVKKVLRVLARTACNKAISLTLRALGLAFASTELILIRDTEFTSAKMVNGW
jgi:hypothetical protein